MIRTTQRWFLGCLICWVATTAGQARAAVWDFDTGDTQGWYGDPKRRNPTLSIAAGRNSPHALLVTGATNSVIRIINPGIESDDLLGSGVYGTWLPIGYGAAFFLDLDRAIPNVHSINFEVVIYGTNTHSGWFCYPFDGLGGVVSLGDGWFRHTFANLYAFRYSEQEPPPPEELQNSILIRWAHMEADGDRIDNLTIRPVAPSLSTTVSQSGVSIGWTASATNFVLEASSILSSAVSWQPVTNAVELAGNMFAVTVKAEDASRFFRLRQTTE